MKGEEANKFMTCLDCTIY